MSACVCMYSHTINFQNRPTWPGKFMSGIQVYIFRHYRPCSYLKVIGSRSRQQHTQFNNSSTTRVTFVCSCKRALRYVRVTSDKSLVHESIQSWRCVVTLHFHLRRLLWCMARHHWHVDVYQSTCKQVAQVIWQRSHPGNSRPPLMFPGSPRVITPNKTLIHSAVFAQQSHMKPRDRLTNAGITDRSSLHLMHSMRPKTYRVSQKSNLLSNQL